MSGLSDENEKPMRPFDPSIYTLWSSGSVAFGILSHNYNILEMSILIFLKFVLGWVTLIIYKICKLAIKIHTNATYIFFLVFLNGDFLVCLVIVLLNL